MSAATSQPASPDPQRFRGQVAYLFAFDIAYDTTREPLTTILGQPVEEYVIGGDKRTPRTAFFFKPQLVRLPAVECGGPAIGKVAMQRSVKFFPVGAIGVTLRIPFDNKTLAELVEYHDADLNGRSLQDEARAVAEQVRAAMAKHLVRPAATLKDEEAYTVFCLEPSAAWASPAEPVPRELGLRGTSEAWLRRHRRDVAALLTQEPNPADLSEQEANDTVSRYLSYYDRDLVVIDWDAALLIDEPRNVSETLHIMELANVQLAELEVYDRMLDETVDRSYADLSGGLFTGPKRRRSRLRLMRDLREYRLDLSRLSDELSNTAKFFGDWHLARVYTQLAQRFHLAAWHKLIDEKLKTLDDLYQLLRQEQTNRWMMILEVTIVLLFIIDVVIIVLQWKQH